MYDKKHAGELPPKNQTVRDLYDEYVEFLRTTAGKMGVKGLREHGLKYLDILKKERGIITIEAEASVTVADRYITNGEEKVHYFHVIFGNDTIALKHHEYYIYLKGDAETGYAVVSAERLPPHTTTRGDTFYAKLIDLVKSQEKISFAGNDFRRITTDMYIHIDMEAEDDNLS